MDKKIYYSNHKVCNELYPINCGHAKVDLEINSKLIYQYIFYSLHFIKSGSGWLSINGKEFKLNTGDFFLIFPNAKIQYYSDENNLWEIVWHDFSGSEAEKYVSGMMFSIENPVYRNASKKIVDLFLSSEKLTSNLKMFDLKLFNFLINVIIFFSEERNDFLINITNKKENAFEKALQYITNNYFKYDLTLNIVAMFVGYTPNYFSAYFKQNANKTFSQFLKELRITKACEFFREGESLVKDVARTVGYNSEFHFSEEFKKVVGVSPSQYKIKYKNIE